MPNHADISHQDVLDSSSVWASSNADSDTIYSLSSGPSAAGGQTTTKVTKSHASSQFRPLTANLPPEWRRNPWSDVESLKDPHPPWKRPTKESGSGFRSTKARSSNSADTDRKPSTSRYSLNNAASAISRYGKTVRDTVTGLTAATWRYVTSRAGDIRQWGGSRAHDIGTYFTQKPETVKAQTRTAQSAQKNASGKGRTSVWGYATSRAGALRKWGNQGGTAISSYFTRKQPTEKTKPQTTNLSKSTASGIGSYVRSRASGMWDGTKQYTTDQCSNAWKSTCTRTGAAKTRILNGTWDVGKSVVSFGATQAGKLMKGFGDWVLDEPDGPIGHDGKPPGSNR